MEKKLEKFKFKPSEEKPQTNHDHVQELDFLFNYDECDYKSSTMKGLNIHVGKQHKIRDQVDGADYNDFKEYKGVQTKDPLLIFLQGFLSTNVDKREGVGGGSADVDNLVYFVILL